MEVDIIYGISIAAVVLFAIAQLGRIIRTSALHKTLRQGIEKGQALNPDVLDRMEKAPDSRSVDQRIGFVLIAIALALFASAAIVASPDNFRAMSAIAMFPLFVGAALLLRLRLADRERAEP